MMPLQMPGLQSDRLVMFLLLQLSSGLGLDELGAIMQTEFLCVSVLRVASGPRVVS